MFRFLSLSVALFLLFGAAWVWFTGDMRPVQLSHWQSMISGETAGATTANVGGSVTTVAKRAAPTPAANPADMVKLAFSRVGSPTGRYVAAKAASTAGKGSSSGMAATLMRLGSPTGRYVSAPKMTATATKTVVAVFKRLGSPLGRYVTAPAAAAPVPKGYKRIGSPGGRYVKAPKMVVKKKPTPKYKVVGSPGGRYVKAPKVVIKKKPAPKYKVVGSPGGRYVSGPKKLARVSSPGGRYVNGPAVKTKPARLVRIGSPSGRYVKGPAPAPRKSASGALVFPINFEYRKSSFTPKGREAVDQLLNYVRSKNYSSITLSGHTDSRGSDKVNMRVSERRLKAVAKHLRKSGYKGDISLVPKGKSQPFDGVDRSKHTEEELYDLDRRVELVSGS